MNRDINHLFVEFAFLQMLWIRKATIATTYCYYSQHVHVRTMAEVYSHASPRSPKSAVNRLY